jgi:hypothetical protein
MIQTPKLTVSVYRSANGRDSIVSSMGKLLSLVVTLFRDFQCRKLLVLLLAFSFVLLSVLPLESFFEVGGPILAVSKISCRTLDGNNDDTTALERAAAVDTTSCRRSTFQSYTIKTIDVNTNIIVAIAVKTADLFVIYSCSIAVEGYILIVNGQYSSEIGKPVYFDTPPMKFVILVRLKDRRIELKRGSCQSPRPRKFAFVPLFVARG